MARAPALIPAPPLAVGEVGGGHRDHVWESPGEGTEAIGDWRLAIGDWRLEISDWRLEISRSGCASGAKGSSSRCNPSDRRTRMLAHPARRAPRKSLAGLSAR